MTKVRHSVSQETPLPLYLTLMLQAETRKRDIIDKLFTLGLCVSYDRFLQVSANLGNRACDRYDVNDGLNPPGLLKGLFTTAAVDNIDYDISSTNATDSFHGTAISLTQHCDLDYIFGSEPESYDFNNQCKAVKPLPSSYTTVSPVGSLKKM